MKRDERDAARYRWLRQRIALRRLNAPALPPNISVHVNTDYVHMGMQFATTEGFEIAMAELDALVDTALKT